MAITPQVLDVYPADSAEGIAIADKVTVKFDQEMDRSSINSGTFVLIGKDEAPVFGPIDVTPFDDPGFEDEDILSSPYVGAYVKGTITFEKVDSNGDVVAEDSIVDEDGDGTLWFTRAIFTPDKPLTPNSEYQIVILGDEDTNDNLDTGVKTRTVFDPKSVAVTGDGTISTYGGYTGTASRTYTVEFTSDGSTGTAEYQWWHSDDLLTLHTGLSTTGERELSDGVFITCSADGSFVTGDKFTIVVEPPYVLENNYRWIFVTGSGAIAVPPSISSASGIEALVVSGDFALEIVEMTPEHQDTNLDPNSVQVIKVVFNKEIDASTITDETIKVWTESVNEDPRFPAEGEVAIVLSVDGNVVTIQLS